MSLKDNNKKIKQNNLPIYPNIHDIQKQINFIKKNNNNKNLLNANNFIQSKFNYKKIIQNKKPSQPIHENRSSSVSNLFQKDDDKKSLIFFPINLKVPSINKNWKNIEKEKNKSIDIIKIPKNNINNNDNKIKENNNINYIFNTYNLSSKNQSYKLIKKKTIENINKENNNNAFSNSMILLNNNNNNNNNNKVITINSNNKTILAGVTTFTHDQSQTIDTNNGYNIKNIRFDEVQKDKERLNALFNEKIKDSQKINEKINEFEMKNKILEKKINKYKEENDNLASTLDKVIKLIKLLKNSGFDVAEILNNLSAYDDEESDESETKKKDEDEKSVSSFKDYSIKMCGEVGDLNLSEDENDTDRIKCHDNFKQSRMNVKDGNDIPKLNIKKIISNKNKKNASNQQEDFSFKNIKKMMSHSVGD